MSPSTRVFLTKHPVIRQDQVNSDEASFVDSQSFIGGSLFLPFFARAASLETSSEVGRRDYNIEVAAGSDPATFIPVTEIRGSKPGPTLFVATGVHGYEFAPILAAEKLAEAIDPKQLSGVVLVTRPSQ